MPREWRNDEDRGLVVGPRLFVEMQLVAVGMGGDHLFGDGDLLAVDRYRADAKIRSIMGHSGIGQQLHRSCGAPDERKVLDQRPRLGENTAKNLGGEANRGEYVAVYLIGVVKHISSFARDPRFANLLFVETALVSIDR